LSVLAVPMLHDGSPIGAITVAGVDAGAFSERQIELLQTFADQAVIAIENVRLFTELQEKNRALTEAHAQVTESLEQQTATAGILRVISSSPAELQPVFEPIVESGGRVCEGVSEFVQRVVCERVYGSGLAGELRHGSAEHHTVTPRAREAFERRYPAPPSRMSMIAQAILDRTIIHVRDFEQHPDVPPASREMARAAGHR